MKIEKNTWHAKLFFWSTRALRKFKYGQNWDKKILENELLDRGTNLCEYIRTTFFWMPLVVLLHVVSYGMAIAALLVAPVAFFGIKSYLITSASIVITLIVAIIALVTFIFISDQISQYLMSRIRKVKRGEFSGFAKVFAEWAKAKKEKICPLVEFINEEKERVS